MDDLQVALETLRILAPVRVACIHCKIEMAQNETDAWRAAIEKVRASATLPDRSGPDERIE